MKNFLDEKLNEIFKKEKIAGACVALTNKEKIIYKNGFGVENAQRCEIKTHPDSLYRIASLTKMVTGLTIMKLCEDGILNLDTTIDKYLPRLKLNKDAQKTITLRHLLSHKSGLPSEYTPEGAREESALEESLKGELANCTLESEPQQLKHLYSNLGIRLASLIAQQKTGEYYSALAKKYVLNPLGMTKTTFDLRDAATYPLSLPHTAEDNGFEVEHHIKENAARLAAGGLYSNTDDLSRLARCILNGGKADNGKEIVSQKTLDEMINHKWNYIKTGKDSCYGLTMTIKEYKDGFLAGHLGNAAPYGAGFFCDIKKGYGAIVLMNTFNSDLRYEIPKMIMEML